MDIQGVMGSVVSIVLNLVMLLVGGGIVAGLSYWLFVIKRRKIWLVDIWERKADGKIYLVAQDYLREIRYNKGKSVAYILKNAKKDVIPPPVECVHRYRNKEYVSYLRLLNDYIPMQNTIQTPDNKQTLIQKIFNIKKALKTGNEAKVLDKYIYAPIKKEIVGSIKFEPMDYDVSLMMTNTMDTTDKVYAEKQDFWSKYGVLIGIGAVVVLAIVVIYLSYEYGQFVVQQTISSAQQTGSMLEAVYDKIGGTPPPS